MADLDTEQLQEALEDLTKTLNGLGNTATGADKKFHDAGDRLFKVKGAGEQLQKSLNELGSATKQLTSTIYKGQATASDYAKATEQAADAFGSFASMFGIWGKVLGAAISLVTKYFGAAARQADTLYKGFQDLQKVGGATSAGFADIQENLRNFRLGINDIDKMIGMIGANAPQLAMFGGSVAKGAKAVGQMAAGITRGELLEKFMNMGISLDEINANAFGFAGIMARTGAVQNKTTQEITKSLEAYIKETDAITRLTGATRQQQEEARNAALAIDAFRLEQERATKSTDENEKARAKSALEVFNMFSAMGPEGKKVAEAFAMTRQGIISEGAALDISKLTGTQALSIFMDDTLTSAEKVQKTIEVMNRSAEGMGEGMIATGKMRETFGFSFAGIKDLGRMSEQLTGRLAEITQREGETNDAYVKRMTALGIANMNARDNMQDFISAGIGPATAALQGLTSVVEKLTSLLPGGAPSGRAQIANTVAQRQAAAQGKGFFGQMMAGMGAGLSATFGGKPAGTLGSIRDMIAKAESGGDYNVLVGGQKADLVNMTLQQVYDLQQQLISQGKGSAAGRYQIINQTLLGLASKLGLDPSTTKFDEATQDRLADELIRQRGYDRYVAGTLSKQEFLAGLSQEWAGLPKDTSGVSHYAGVGNNKATIGYQEALASLATGGVVSGPKSGFSAQLHGTEAVVPLPDGKTIPVSMPELTMSMGEQTTMLAQQITKLDEIVSVLRNQNTISSKILQATTS